MNEEIFCNNCGLENTDDNAKIYIISAFSFTFSGIIMLLYIYGSEAITIDNLWFIIGIILISTLNISLSLKIKKNSLKIISIGINIISIIPLILLIIYTPQNDLETTKWLAYTFLMIGLIPNILQGIVTVYQRKRKIGVERLSIERLDEFTEKKL